MAKIKCGICDKTLRGESGLAWHVEHVHGSPEEHSSEEPNRGQTDTGAADPGLNDVLARLSALEEKVANLADQHTEGVDRLREELHRQDHSAELSLLQGTADQLEARLASVESKVQRLEDLYGAVTALKREVAELRRLSLSAARLVGNLHLDQRVSRGSSEQLGGSLRSSAVELEQARALLGEHLEEDSLLTAAFRSVSD